MDAILAQFQELNELLPVNSKAFKKLLRESEPKALRALLREIDKLETRLYKVTSPIEWALEHKTGRFR